MSFLYSILVSAYRLNFGLQKPCTCKILPWILYFQENEVLLNFRKKFLNFFPFSFSFNSLGKPQWNKQKNKTHKREKKNCRKVINFVFPTNFHSPFYSKIAAKTLQIQLQWIKPLLIIWNDEFLIDFGWWKFVKTSKMMRWVIGTKLLLQMKIFWNAFLSMRLVLTVFLLQLMVDCSEGKESLNVFVE